MRRRLVDRQPDFIESGHFQVLESDVPLNVIEGEIRNRLFQHDIVLVHGDVPRKVVPVDGDFLVWGGLTTFHVQRRKIRVIHEQIVMYESFQRGR